MSAGEMDLEAVTDEAKQKEGTKTDEEKSSLQEQVEPAITDDEKTTVGKSDTDNTTEPATGGGDGELKTDDDKIETESKTEVTEKTDQSEAPEVPVISSEGAEEKGGKSPEPEYTPPSSSASWVTDEGTRGTSGADKKDDSVEAQTDKDMSSEAPAPVDVTTSDKKEEEAPGNDTETTPNTVSEGEDKPAGDTQQPVPEVNDTTVTSDAKDTEAVKNDDPVDDQKNEPVVSNSGEAIDKEKLDKKIRENEELQQKLESTLSNQEGERAAFKTLTEENAKLQKHHDDMKEKLEDIQAGHFMLQAELETLRQVNADQKDQIAKLETEVRVLKETQGGDEVVKDLQEKLIRLSNEQEEKDKRVHSLEGQLDATEEKLKQAEANAGRNENAPKSKTCSIM